MTDRPPLGLYVHWPYCARICPYCDFNVALDKHAGESDALHAAILADLRAEAARFAAFAAAGVNRLSLGVQALDDAALAFLGRNHSAAEAIAATRVAAARSSPGYKFPS